MALPRRTLFLVTIAPPLILCVLLYRLELTVLLPDMIQLASGPLSALLYRPKASTNSGSAKPFVRHIVAVGDLHGDMSNARRVLQFSGVVDEYGNWTGHADFFVQTGDIIDRWVTFFRFWRHLQLNIDAYPQAGTIPLLFLTGWINCVHKLCLREGPCSHISEITNG
jgi:Calcineurin-like phosphoesterase